LELRTYTEVVPFKEKSSFHFVVLGKILNGMEYKKYQAMLIKYCSEMPGYGKHLL
jgi:hypothetical protein